MLERLTFEHEVSRLEPDICTQTLKQLGARLSSTSRKGDPPELADVRAVMWQIIAILQKTGSVNAADPDKVRNPPSGYRAYVTVLRQWFLICYGEPSGSSRTLLSGSNLRAKVDTAFAATQPLLDLLTKHGGKEWQQVLRSCFYRKVAELDHKAAVTVPRTRRASIPVELSIPLRVPRQVSYAEFMSFATRASQTYMLQRGIGGTPFGSYKPGVVFDLAGGEQRALVWAGGEAVFFLRGGEIFIQHGNGFADDVLFGSVAKGAEQAAGAMMLAQLMVDVGLSFTPWGVLWDGVSTLRDVALGDWTGAAQSLLPGAALKVATSVRAAGKVRRGGAVTKALAGQIAGRKGTGSLFIGRGGYQLNGKWHRGKWLVEESGQAGAPKKYHFLDDTDNRLREVEEKAAREYMTCSRCVYNTRGKKGALIGQVDEILTDISVSPHYATKRGPIIPRKAVHDVVVAYGPEADQVVENILNFWMGSPNAAKHAEDTLVIAKRLSPIKAKSGYQDAADIFADLMVNSKTTAQGALFELEWAANHVDEIDAMGVPSHMPHWEGTGKGLDILKKDGTAVELKNYDFTKSIYSDNPARVAAGICEQMRSRLKWKDEARVTGMTVIFNSRAGPMPAALKRELDEAARMLTKEHEREIRFQFWPR